MTDSQYLASIEISKDQNVMTGVTVVAVEFWSPVYTCRTCAFVSGSAACEMAPCSPEDREDGRNVIFVVKSGADKLKLESSK